MKDEWFGGSALLQKLDRSHSTIWKFQNTDGTVFGKQEATDIE
jgi:hypothetical protein